MDRRKLLWVFVTLLLSILTLLAVFRSGGITAAGFAAEVRSSSLEWLLAGVLCAFLFIFSEGEALRVILKGFGQNPRPVRSFLYSAVDIYFSAITPSATGGQPASAFFMMKDGVSGPVVTVTLLLNVSLYTMSLITLGTAVLVAYPSYFMAFPTVCRIAIIIGVAVMFMMMFFIVAMLRNERIVLRLGDMLVRFLRLLRLRPMAARLERRLGNAVEEYRKCIGMINGRKGMIMKAYLLNLLQRSSQITVSVCAYMALHGDASLCLEIFVIQTFVVLGSNFIPIPGAIGISEYLMLFGYGFVMSEGMAFNTAILSRGISFYTCLAISIVTVIFGYALMRRKSKETAR